jgi:hypothetical protein
MANGAIKRIRTSVKSGVNFEQADDEIEEFDFPTIFYQNIKNLGKSYPLSDNHLL